MNTKPQTQKRLKQINIALRLDELEQLKKICYKKNTTMSQLIRDAIFYIIVSDNKAI